MTFYISRRHINFFAKNIDANSSALQEFFDKFAFFGDLIPENMRASSKTVKKHLVQISIHL
jgi:hypothetical protein